MDMMLVGTHIARGGRRHPDKIALIDGDRRLTWGELDRRSNRVATALQRRGIAHGDKIGFVAEAGIEWVIAYLGIVKLGIVYKAIFSALAFYYLAIGELLHPVFLVFGVADLLFLVGFWLFLRRPSEAAAPA